MKFDTFIGLEIHIHLITKSKMFCACRARYGDEPNSNVCPVCLGYPGVLPTVNEEAMKMGYIVARALNCKLSEKTFFERKNYFYPDMPKNYQISQFQEPVGTNGYMEFEFNGEVRKIRIHDVHLEEDAGKMIHAGDISLLDFNRAGYPLLEIVTEPDLRTGEDTEAFLRSFQRMVRYLNVCDGNMEEGSMKCDANVSINFKGKGLGTKVELKNMNSPRFVRKGLNYEIERQGVCLDTDKPIFQETRLWNENRDQTEVMRRKEEANDYRYFPEPDMPPFMPDAAFMKEVEDRQRELPFALQRRLEKEYGLSTEQSDALTEEVSTAEYFEAIVKQGIDPQKFYAWFSSDIKKMLNRYTMLPAESPLTPDYAVELLQLVDKGTISGKIAKKVLEAVFDEKKAPAVIIEEKGLVQISDPSVIEKAVLKVMENNPKVVEQAKEEPKVAGFLVGQIMKETKGKADPGLVNKILRARLSGE